MGLMVLEFFVFRYVATVVTAVHEMENGFQIWSFSGKFLYKLSKDHLYQVEVLSLVVNQSMIVFYCNVLPFTSTEWYQQFSWRPRPPALLAPEKEEEIMRNLKKYSKKYEQEDRDASNQMTEQERVKRTQLEEEWAAWVAKWKQLHEEDHSHRMELRDGDASDDEEEYEAKEVEVEEVVGIIEEVVAFELDH
jgi:translation initiation factor 3 subunit B